MRKPEEWLYRTWEDMGEARMPVLALPWEKWRWELLVD